MALLNYLKVTGMSRSPIVLELLFLETYIRFLRNFMNILVIFMPYQLYICSLPEHTFTQYTLMVADKP